MTGSTLSDHQAAISTLASPTGFRAEVYSRTAAEAFWDRSSEFGLIYFLKLDGEDTGSTDGTSQFFEGLDPNRAYSLELVAIAPDGRRSEPVYLILETDARMVHDPAFPPAPAKARLSVYSSTAAELFWDRAPASAQVVSTEVVRNGVLLGSSPGNSFYDAERAPGADYTYELTAVSSIGVRSESTILGSDPGNGSGNEAPIQNVANILSGISQVATRNAHVIVFPMIQAAFLNPIGRLDGLTLQNSQRFMHDSGVSATRNEYACEGGGVFLAVIFDSRFGRGDLIFDNCRFSGYRFDGNAFYLGSDIGGYTVTYNALSVEGMASGPLTLQGEASRFVTRSITSSMIL